MCAYCGQPIVVEKLTMNGCRGFQALASSSLQYVCICVFAIASRRVDCYHATLER